MTLFQSGVLGLIQGLTEFLPISSSAHLAIFPWLFGWLDPGLSYDVFLHLGTLFALLLYFFRDWWQLSRAGVASIIERRIGFERDRILFWLLVIGTIPGGLAGYLFHTQAETIFRAPLLIAVMLASVGFLIYWVDMNYPRVKSIDELKFTDAVWIGLAQAFAIIPGVSRSGATMGMGRLLGLTRESSARFSFLLATPITAAATIYEWRRLGLGEAPPVETSVMVVGLITSTVSGLIAIHFLLAYLRNSDFKIFAWYRVLLAGVIVALSILLKR